MVVYLLTPRTYSIEPITRSTFVAISNCSNEFSLVSLKECRSSNNLKFNIWTFFWEIENGRASQAKHFYKCPILKGLKKGLYRLAGLKRLVSWIFQTNICEFLKNILSYFGRIGMSALTHHSSASGARALDKCLSGSTTWALLPLLECYFHHLSTTASTAQATLFFQNINISILINIKYTDPHINPLRT